LIVIIIATILLQVPASFFTKTNNALRYFLIGTLFNLIRIFALGIAIGYGYDKLIGGER
jgi:hypothetical protein